jgi:hypothetical protein
MKGLKRSEQLEFALEELKMEVAMELGIDIPVDGYYGRMTTREVGLLGGGMVRKLVAIAYAEFNGIDTDARSDVDWKLYGGAVHASDKGH